MIFGISTYLGTVKISSTCLSTNFHQLDLRNFDNPFDCLDLWNSHDTLLNLWDFNIPRHGHDLLYLPLDNLFLNDDLWNLNDFLDDLFHGLLNYPLLNLCHLNILGHNLLLDHLPLGDRLLILDLGNLDDLLNN